jgi:hypothetical protein
MCNSSSISQFDVSRFMKLHYSATQFDIQSIANDGNLNDVRMINLVRHRFVVGTRLNEFALMLFLIIKI